MLQIVDAQWKDHLYSLDHLKEGIGLRGYGQRDPLVEYKKESYALFQDMKARIEEEIVRYLFWLRPVIDGGAMAAERRCAAAAAPLAATMTMNNRQRRPFRRLPAPLGANRRRPRRSRAARADRRRRRDQDRRARRAEGRPERSRALAAAARNTRSATEPEPSGT